MIDHDFKMISLDEITIFDDEQFKEWLKEFFDKFAEIMKQEIDNNPEQSLEILLGDDLLSKVIKTIKSMNFKFDGLCSKCLIDNGCSDWCYCTKDNPIECGELDNITCCRPFVKK